MKEQEDEGKRGNCVDQHEISSIGKIPEARQRGHVKSESEIESEPWVHIFWLESRMNDVLFVWIGSVAFETGPWREGKEDETTASSGAE